MLLNKMEAALYIDSTIHAMRSWRCANKGPSYIRVGKGIRYRQSDLDAWLDSRTMNHGGNKAMCGK